MIEKINYKPECFNIHKEGITCFTLSDERGKFAYLGIEPIGNDATVHFVYDRFTNETLKTTKQDWIDVKALIRRMGFNRVFATKEYTDKDDCEKFSRFIRHFGFTNSRIIYMSHQEV